MINLINLYIFSLHLYLLELRGLPGLVGVLQGRLLVALVGPQDEAVRTDRRLAAQAIEGLGCPVSFKGIH